MDQPWKLGAVAAATAIARGDLTATELLASVADRVDELNPRLNAITVNRLADAAVEAEEADAAVAAGESLGPLHGVPVTIKENTDVAGYANPNGVPAYADLMATVDAPLVGRLKAAGAIVIGLTNTPEFSMRGTTDNPLRGRTFNPWGDDISPGGSSGGAGVAAATGMGALHHGNDIGGSLRFPTVANGVVTVKPTSFRVPVHNASALGARGPLAQAISVQGLIGRHVDDIRTGMQVIIEPDPRDPLSPPVPWTGPEIERRVVAVSRQTDGHTLHPGIAALIDQAAAQLAEAGWDVVEVDAPPIGEASRGWFSALITEMRELFEEPLRRDGSATIGQIFDWYYELSTFLDLKGYVQASGARTDLMRTWNLFLDEYPLLLSPFLLGPMYDWDHDAQSAENVADLFASSVWSTGVNYLGLPSGVIGTGLVEGRPAGVQLVGRRYREDVICDGLEAIEARTPALTAELWSRLGGEPG